MRKKFKQAGFDMWSEAALLDERKVLDGWAKEVFGDIEKIEKGVGDNEAGMGHRLDLVKLVSGLARHSIFPDAQPEEITSDDVEA